MQSADWIMRCLALLFLAI